MVDVTFKEAFDEEKRDHFNEAVKKAYDSIEFKFMEIVDVFGVNGRLFYEYRTED